MGRVKEILYDRIYRLAEASGYDEENLMELWFDYVEECYSDGDSPSWAYFRDVTMERDW